MGKKVDRPMMLRASVCTSTDETDIDYTESEWNSISDKAKSDIIREFLGNVCDICVTPMTDEELKGL